MTRQRTAMKLKRQNFSLLEIMIVIAIIAAIAGIAVTNLLGRADEANSEITKQTIKQVEDTLKMYYVSKKEFPSSEEGLSKLVEERYLNEIPKDAWGEELKYMYPGSHEGKEFDLWSTGKDKSDGGEGPNADITNWTRDE